MSDLARTLEQFALWEAGGAAIDAESITEAKVMARKRGTSTGKAHAFGGDWTTIKLDIVGKYLAAYTKALQGKPTVERPFIKAYIDAFAGTGYRTLSDANTDDVEDSTNEASLALPDLAASEPQQLLDGSARIALKVEPRFDRYIFIERRKKHVQELENLKAEFPALAPDIRVTRGDANEEIQVLCAKNWTDRRAVLFLDPYGMQVEWDTIVAVARTKAIDLWLLFPLGIGVNRLVTRSGEIPESWQRRLDLLLGTPDWREEFYSVEQDRQLFGEPKERIVKASIETTGRYFNKRLEGVFPGVAPKPAVLRNSVGNPLFLFCFAAANEKGAPIAVKIANHLLKGLS